MKKMFNFIYLGSFCGRRVSKPMDKDVLITKVHHAIKYNGRKYTRTILVQNIDYCCNKQKIMHQAKDCKSHFCLYFVVIKSMLILIY